MHISFTHLSKVMWLHIWNMPIICTHIKIRYRWCMWLPAYAVLQHQSPQRDKNWAHSSCSLLLFYPGYKRRCRSTLNPPRVGSRRSMPCAQVRFCCKQCVLKSPGPVPSSTCAVSAMCYLWKTHKVSHSCMNLCQKDVASSITAFSVEQIRIFETTRGRFHQSWEYYQPFIANITQRHLFGHIFQG